MRSYKDALRVRGVKPIPKYSKLRTSKAKAKPGDLELVPNGAVKIATSDLTQSTDTPKLHLVKAA
jgi:hypothetical protein